jgi:hypothetical protein
VLSSKSRICTRENGGCVGLYIYIVGGLGSVTRFFSLATNNPEPGRKSVWDVWTVEIEC